MADQPLPQPYSDAEIADVIAQVRDAGSYASSPESREHYERLAATLAELDGLRQDKERLDWLDSKRILHIHGDAPGDFEFSPRGMGLRAAIDLEMEGRP